MGNTAPRPRRGSRAHAGRVVTSDVGGDPRWQRCSWSGEWFDSFTPVNVELLGTFHMHAIALAGRHPDTASWMHSLLSLIGLSADSLLRYRHWDGTHEASIEYEANLLSELRTDLLIAKSFGTHVAALAHQQNDFRPRAAILIGTPISQMSDRELSRLRSFVANQPTLFIQQDADPGGGAASLKAIMRLQNANLVAVAGSDHLYNNVAELAAIVLEWPTFTNVGA